MFISLDWISDFVDISDVDPKVVADKLTMATAEVEGISYLTRHVKGVLVGEILSAKPFQTPEGKTRTLCVVDCGVGLFNMHAPMEIAGKLDIYMGFKAYKAFLAID